MGRTKVDARVALAANIRERAEHFGGLERLRAKTRLSNGTFYALAAAKGHPPTHRTLRCLHGAGVPIPEEFVSLE